MVGDKIGQGLDGASKKERLDALASMATTCRAARAGARDLPLDEADLLSKDTSMPIRLAISNRRVLSEETVRRLAKDGYTAIRLQIAARSGLPEDVLLSFCADASKHVRMAVAKNDDALLPTEGRAALLSDPDPDVLAAMAERADLTDGEIRILADAQGGDILVLRGLASRHVLSHDCAEFLARKGEKKSLRALAGKSSVSEGTALEILVSGDFEARRLLAVHSFESLPSLLVRSKLAVDRAHPVALLLLDNAADIPTLLFLALSPYSPIRCRAVLKASKSSAHEVLEGLETACALHPRRRRRLAAAAKEVLVAAKG